MRFMILRAVWQSGAQGCPLTYLRPLIEELFPDIHYIDSNEDSDEDSDMGSMPPLEEID